MLNIPQQLQYHDSLNFFHKKWVQFKANAVPPLVQAIPSPHTNSLSFDLRLVEGYWVAVDTTKGDTLHPQLCFLTPEHGHVSSSFAS